MSSERRRFERHDPAGYVRRLAYRSRDELPFDLGDVPADAVLMLDATVYVDAQKSKVPPGLARRLAGSEIRHSAIALGELAADLGLLDPRHPGTPGVLLETLHHVDPTRTVAPSPDAWLEASLLAGILARTQGLPRPDRRKLLNDALIFLSAEEQQAVLVSRNVRDFDLLLQLRPDVQVLLYDA